MSETKDGRHFLRGFQSVTLRTTVDLPKTQKPKRWLEAHPTRQGRDDELPLTPLMNNTKWDELRLAMYDLGDISPRWRTKDLSGYLCEWDGDWFHHFRTGGYETIEWVEIQILSVEQEAAVLRRLQEIHLPGHRIEQGFRIYGNAVPGSAIAYI